MPSIVYVPGFMQRASAWDPVAARLAERYPPVFVDHDSYELAGRADEIAAAAPPGSVLCGYSLGGRLCLHAALRAPERYAGLVMLGASAGIEDPAVRAERGRADEELAAWMESHPIEAIVERWEALPVFASQSAELVAAQRPGRQSFDPAGLAQLLRSAGQGATEPAWDRLPAIPLLAIAGAWDTAYSEAALALEQRAPNGSAVLISGAGHAAHLERPELAADAIAGLLQTIEGSTEP